MPYALKRLVALICLLFLLLGIFQFFVALALRARGEDPASYISQPISLGLILILAIACWFLRDELQAMTRRNSRSGSP